MHACVSCFSISTLSFRRSLTLFFFSFFSPASSSRPRSPSCSFGWDTDEMLKRHRPTGDSFSCFLWDLACRFVSGPARSQQLCVCHVLVECSAARKENATPNKTRRTRTHDWWPLPLTLASYLTRSLLRSSFTIALHIWSANSQWLKQINFYEKLPVYKVRQRSYQSELFLKKNKNLQLGLFDWIGFGLPTLWPSVLYSLPQYKDCNNLSIYPQVYTMYIMYIKMSVIVVLLVVLS